MSPHSISVSDAIERHRHAVLVDEAQFDDAGKALNEATAEVTLAAEQLAYIDLAAAPCAGHADVQAKLAYLLTGSVGERTPLLECLIIDEYGGHDTLAAFLRSLLLEGGR